jgi:phosphate-selective porin OprO/OprP
VTILTRTPNGLLNAALVGINMKQDGLSDDGQAAIFHYEHAPIDIVSQRGVRLGASFSYRINADNARFRSRPEIATANTYFVDTGQIDGVDRIVRGGLEANQMRGRLSWQSEILAARLHRDSAPGLTFWGAYLYASWFLTDDSRNYDLGQGRFVPQHVSSPVFGGGSGAIELAARASHVDLNDGDVFGGKETNLTVGVNWYLTDALRLSGNLVKVLNVDRPGSEFDGSDPLIAAVRLQWLIE